MLKQANCIRRELNTAGLSLQADVGESFLIKAIYIGRVSSTEYLTVKIDNFSVGYWRVYGKRGNELGGIRLSYDGINLMKLLVDRGLPFTLPVAEGQKLTCSVLDGVGDIQVVYDIYDAGDIRSDMPNGTTSKVFAFVQYLRETDVRVLAGDMLLDVSLSLAEFPDFPAGKPVPPNMNIKLHGIHGSPVADYESAGVGYHSTFIKLVREREVLLDEERHGIPFLGDSAATQASQYNKVQSLIGSGGEIGLASNDQKLADPFWFDPPLEFMSGQELNVYMTFVKQGSPTDMTADLPDIGLILECTKI